MDLVTGGAGFVGSHLVDALLAEGRRVRVLDALARRPTDDASRQRRAVERWAGRVDVRVGDVTDPDAVRSALDGVTRVFHLAAATGSRTSALDPAHTLRVNAVGTAVLTEAMDRAGIRQLVLASSAHVYGEAPDRPSRESDLPAPGNPFGASMVAAEAVAQAWQACGRGALGIVRGTTVYGPRMRPDSLVFRAAEAALSGRPLTVFGTGRARRDLLHVEDYARALLAAMDQTGEGTRVVNACTGTSTPVLELVQTVGDRAGARVAIELLPAARGEVQALRADPAHAAATIGFSASIPLSTGLDHAIAWMRKLRAAGG